MIQNTTFFLLILLFLSSSYGQEEGIKFNLIPDNLHFTPLKGNQEEARMGVLYFPNNSNLKVDIGNSVDVAEIIDNSSGMKITAGAEFMAYGHVTSYKYYRLQIDGIDGFFGGNVTYSSPTDNGRHYLRFRFIHRSGHLVDGHWDQEEGKWIGDQTPSPYGRNFAELVYARTGNFLNGIIRYYSGASLKTSGYTAKKEMKPLSANAGFEYNNLNLLGKILNEDTNILFVIHLDLSGTPKYLLNQNYMAGIKFGIWDKKGITIYLSHYTGSDYFSQYFELRTKRTGIGFNIDF